jgi:methionyl-tRNA formyltransferase
LINDVQYQIFMGTPDFSTKVLEMLIAEHEVIAVVTQPDRPVVTTAMTSCSAINISSTFVEKSGVPIKIILLIVKINMKSSQ